MRAKNNPITMTVTVATILFLALAGIPHATAVEASSLAVSEAADYLGEWLLTMDFGGRSVDMSLTVSDVNGKVAATLNSAIQPKPQIITDITKDGDRLILKYDSNFGMLTISAKREGEFLSGSVAAGNGGFSSIFTGVKQAAKVSASDIQPSSLSLSGGAGFQSIRGFLGEWVLTLDVPEGDPMGENLLLTFLDVDGKLGATLQSSAQTQPQIITDITQASLALKLRYAAQFGETETGMVLIVRLLESGTLTGSISDQLGVLGEDVSSEHETLGLGLFSARVRGTKGGKLPGRALLALSGGDTVKISYVPLTSKSSDYKELGNVRNGDVFLFAGARATKLFTDVVLKFGDAVLNTENVGKNYPGVYSLWLKKVGNGWNLVFNEQADIWGTMHDPTADIGEVPLVLTKSDKESTRFEVDLEKQGDGGVLKLAWGPNEWRTKFSIVQ